jgi:hypothetical protein
MTTSYTMQGTGADGSALAVSATYTPPAVPSGPTFPAGADTLKLGTASATVPLSGINPNAETNPAGVGFAAFRGVGQAVIYTTGSTTTTNQWGVELQVSSANVIVGIHDRAITGDVTGTPIPSGGYVVSVHDDGDPAGVAAYSRTWGTVGATVTVTASGSGGTTPPPSTGTAWPLKVSANGRNLVDQNGAPFLVAADTAWTAFAALLETDAKQYIDTKYGQGFNTLMVLTTDWARNGTPAPAAGYAFNSSGSDITSPIEGYWQRFDRLIDYAAAKNMLVMIGVLALSDNGTNGSNAPTTAQAQTYATWLANRYKNKGNIVYFLGGDAQYETATTLEDALFNSLKAADGGAHLITFHPSWDNYNLATSWPVNFNSIQWNTDGTPYPADKAKTGYQQSTVRPFFLMEPAYYPSPAVGNAITRLRNRQDAWWTITQGALGVAYGGERTGTWSIGHKGATPNWSTTGDVTGTDVGNVRKVLEQYHWEKLIPSFDSTVVTARSSALNYITVARASDGSLIVVYTPTGGTITVDLSKLAGAGTAQWFDPSTGLVSGSATNIGNTGQQTFTPPSANAAGDHDWVLVLKQTATSGGGSGTPVTITERTPTYTEASSAQSVSPTLPSGLVDQDTVVVWATVPGTSVSQLTEPSGWSRVVDPFTVADNNIAGAWYKRHTTASPVSAPTISTSAAANRTAAICTALVGVDPTNILDVAASAATTSPYGTSIAPSALQTINDGAYLLSGGLLDSSSALFTSTPSGMAVTATTTGGSVGRGISLASQTLATAGSSGSKSWGSGASLGLGAFLAAFRPGGSANTGGGGTTPPPSTGAWSLTTYGMVWPDSPNVNFNTLDSTFTDICISFANSSGGMPGGLVGDGPQGLAATKSQIASLRARGVKVLLSFGGGGYNVNYSSSTAFLQSLVASANYYGLTMWDGINWDDEGSFNGSAAVALSRAAKQAYGSTFKVTWAPNGSTIDAYVAAVRGNLDVVDEFGQQFYDSQVSYAAALGRVDQMMAAGIPASKIAIGMMLGNDANHWTMSQCKQYMTQFRTDRGVRRAYLWEISNNSAAWGQAMKAIVQ